MSLLKNAKDTPDDYYTINNFRNELKLIFSSNNYLKKENNKFSKIKYNNNQYKLSLLRKNNSNLNNNEYNDKNDEDKEIIQLESNNKKMENEELKFCLNSIIKIFDKKLYKYSKISNINEEKIKNIKKEIINSNSVIKELNEKIKRLEIAKINENENKDNSENKIEEKNQKNNNNNLIIIKENSILKRELKEQNNKLNKLKQELDSKSELFNEINTLQNELINHKQILNKLKSELNNKNEIIKKLNSLNKKNEEKEFIQLKKALNDICQNNELLKNEIDKYKNNLLLETTNNRKLEEIINLNNNKIKENNDIKNKMKDNYELEINSIIKEININRETKNKNLEEENNKLKNTNKELNIKYKEMLNVKNKYDELMLNIKQINEENEILKNNKELLGNNNLGNMDLNIKNMNITFPNKEINYLSGNNNPNTSTSENNDYKTSPNIYDNIYKKNFTFDKMKKINKNKSKHKEKNISLNDEDINKRPSLSSLIISDTHRIYGESNISDKNSEHDYNDESQGLDINPNFNIYKPVKQGLLVFNILKKTYFIIIPEKYFEFWKEYQNEGSLQYNTLEGLFLINSKNNQLYYYSSKKNIFCDLLTFKENHSYGCLFVDNLSKNIIAIGGKYTKLVELFSFESGKIEDLPELSTHRSDISCCQVNNRIYCLFGNSEERFDDSLIEYLDLDNIDKGWVEINYINNTSFKKITCMSCVNLNDTELLIIGGKINDNIPNEKLIYYNIQSKELCELDKDLPESDNKIYLFTKNIMFNLFLDGKIITFINIDDNNQIHIIDNELKYNLYLAPNLNI